MEKRLKEIVIYILENGPGLDPEQRLQLEEVKAQLSLDGLPVAEIEKAIRRVLETGVAETIATGPLPAGSGEAVHYLDRLQALGLLDEDEAEAILQRAARLRPEGIALADVQFLAASVVLEGPAGRDGTLPADRSARPH
ncbi:MAG: hypothetical protein JW819_11035 [Candidatus Krumholzibacteriota bacterium]|nr:hypothetical protein [Candidatus Krumholzibacteriota bacterium]